MYSVAVEELQSISRGNDEKGELQEVSEKRDI